MNNYWLTEYSNTSDNKENPEDSSPNEDPEDMDDPHQKLNDRQKMMYEHYEMVVDEYGKFDQGGKANGAHYADGELNPFAKAGMICGNCVFFMGGQACELVSGKIDPNGICKLWIIPEELIQE